jgi:hypothetical protein
MRTLYEIQKDILVLLEEAEDVIIVESQENGQRGNTIALSILWSMKRKIKQEFINIKHYLRV